MKLSSIGTLIQIIAMLPVHVLLGLVIVVYTLIAGIINVVITSITFVNLCLKHDRVPSWDEYIRSI